MIWNEKYAPKSLEEFCGNAGAVEQVKRWALDWERGKKGKPVLLWGPPGTGKGALVFALATAMGWETIEMNASDIRNKANVQRVIGASSSSASLFGSRKLILIDDVDSIAGRHDRGGTPAIIEVLKTALNPVILTAGDYWDRSISSVRAHCTGIEFRKVNPHSIASALARILEEEGIEADKETLLKISGQSSGDIRSAVNDLQAVAEGKQSITLKDLSVLSPRDRERSVWDAVRTIMKTMDYGEAARTTWDTDVDPDMFMKWVEENVPAEYEDKKDLARAFQSISRADVFMGRIRARQYWGFLRYVNVLMTSGVALAKKKPYHKFVKYSFPGILKKLSKSKIERARIKAVGLKIGEKCHLSSSEAAELFIPLIKTLMEDSSRVPGIAEYFGFDAPDIAFIIEKSEKQAEKLISGKHPAKKPAGKKVRK